MPKNKAHQLDELLSANLSRDKRHHRAPAADNASARQASAGAAEWIDIELLDDNPYQPVGRLEPAELQSMIESFDREGQMQTVEAREHPTRKGRYQLVFGHRRRAAVAAGANAGIKEVQAQEFIGQLHCVVRELSDLEMLRRATRENSDRLQMSPLQAASMYAQMRELTTLELRESGELDEGKAASWRRVAEFNGYGPNKFSDLQRTAALLELPEVIQRDFGPTEDDGVALNSRHGRALLMFQDDPKQQRALLGQIKRERLSGNHAQKRADEMRRSQPQELDLEIKDQVHRQLHDAVEVSSQTARDANRTALEEGRAHLSMVPKESPEDFVSQGYKTEEDENEMQVLASPGLASSGSGMDTGGGQTQEVSRETKAEPQSAPQVLAWPHGALLEVRIAIKKLQTAIGLLEGDQMEERAESLRAILADLGRAMNE